MAHQAYTRPMLGTGKYRFRTWLRGHTPDVIAQRIPKGSRACGAHEWHRRDEATDACYHCEIGVRPNERSTRRSTPSCARSCVTPRRRAARRPLRRSTGWPRMIASSAVLCPSRRLAPGCSARPGAPARDTAGIALTYQGVEKVGKAHRSLRFGVSFDPCLPHPHVPRTCCRRWSASSPARRPWAPPPGRRHPRRLAVRVAVDARRRRTAALRGHVAGRRRADRATRSGQPPHGPARERRPSRRDTERRRAAVDGVTSPMTRASCPRRPPWTAVCPAG